MGHPLPLACQGHAYSGKNCTTKYQEDTLAREEDQHIEDGRIEDSCRSRSGSHYLRMPSSSRHSRPDYMSQHLNLN